MSTIEPGKELKLKIEKLAYGGEGVFRPEDGPVIFVDRGLPEQTVRVQITEAKKRFARARIINIVKDTPHRVKPFCPHFGSCGGCLWQDLAYEQQLFWKKTFVQENLERIAGLKNTEVPDCLPSPETRHYRNKMEFAFAPHPETGLRLGLHARNSRKIVEVSTCLLQCEKCSAVVNRARELARESGVWAYSAKTGKGFWRFLVLRRAAGDGRGLLHLITAEKPRHEQLAEEFCYKLMEEFPWLAGSAHSVRRAETQVAQGESTIFTMGEERIQEELGDISYGISAQGFFQTNTAAAEQLYETIAKAAGLTGSETIWDLFCGSGGIGLYLAGQAKSVCGLDGNRDALSDARENARDNDLGNCRFVHGDAAKMLGGYAMGIGKNELGERPDVIITDPPRTGMPRPVVEGLLSLAPDRIVSVSCDPATHARDLGLLHRGYDLVSIQPLDMFPHTPHVESVALLTRKDLGF